MEHVTMDTYEMQSFSVEVLGHLIFARSFKPSIDVLKKVLEHYNAMIECPKERLLDAIIFERQLIASNYAKSLPGVTPIVYYSNVMWEYVYTLAYYLNNNSTIWRKHLLPRMKELARNSAIKEDMNKAEKLVDQYIERRIAFEMDLDTYTEQPDNSNEINQLNQQITNLQQQLAQKDARIAELEAMFNHPHLSFIETEGKSPQDIQWAYQDVTKFIKKPASMATCLLTLQPKGMLKGQERYGDLDNIKAIHQELQENYGITWTYAALCRAINRAKAKKKRH